MSKPNTVTRIPDAFKQGYTAFKACDFDNPFPSKLFQHKEWQRGWNTAYFDNLKTLNANGS